jgi:hypothetical protein
MNTLSGYSVAQLKQALTLKVKIETLQGELNALIGSPARANANGASGAGVAPAAKKKTMSPAARARISAAVKARWAKIKGSSTPAIPAAKPAPQTKAKGTISAEGRAKLAALAKARWAKIRAAGKSKL